MYACTYLTTAHNALVLVVAKRALVTYADECGRSDVAVAYWAFAITFITEAADRYACLLAAHH
jgi:hypothetical protein